MLTPRGVFELKYFFTAAIASSQGGTAHSAEAVRHQIKAMLSTESPHEVLSDEPQRSGLWGVALHQIGN
ncbi:hypothetical protein [Mesorhizobium captivum]|uniref:RNA polymerase factor sigma-54 n=1 Tax=Mesorhizobium captivum TaxID=3072319 RepID=UPI003D6BFDDC